MIAEWKELASLRIAAKLAASLALKACGLPAHDAGQLLIAWSLAYQS